MKLENFRQYHNIVSTNNPSNKKSPLYLPSEIESSGRCESNNVKATNEEFCSEYEWFKKSLEYVDSYNYTPDCLLELERGRYMAFVYCVDSEKAIHIDGNSEINEMNIIGSTKVSMIKGIVSKIPELLAGERMPRSLMVIHVN